MANRDLFGYPTFHVDYYHGTFSNAWPPIRIPCGHGPNCTECVKADTERKASEAARAARQRKLRREAAVAVCDGGTDHPLIQNWIETGAGKRFSAIPGPDWALLERVRRMLDVADERPPTTAGAK